MSHYSFKLPDLGEGIVVSEVVEWHVAVGEQVDEDQHICDVMTDKAVVEVTSPVTGKVEKLACEAGIEIPVGSELILFATAAQSNIASDNLAAATDTAAVEQPGTVANQATGVPEVNTKSLLADNALTSAVLKRLVLTSPSVRKRARTENIDLSVVAGSGASGRINNSDLEAFIAAGGTQASLPVTKLSSAGTTREVKISGLRRIIAQKMLQSSNNIPHYAYIEEVDLTALEALRKHLNDNRKPEQQKLTILPFIMQALVKVVADFPHCNAHYNADSEILTQHSAVHVGIATMTPQGLMVPVVKDTQTLDIWGTAAQMAAVTELTRSGKASSAQLSGSTITITSLGAIGGIATTPIINAPETTIVGINKMQQRPVVIDGQIVIRKMMNLSSSFDHRIVDGYDGALMIQALKSLLENPGAIFV
ncbi:MAG: lipoamide acyltransferase component of branched-chain alpha-keto aciddehydrogenase complex [Osedax symbiont Rs2]|nr:MAG: lipoamide acyltransferase component of branched-chain alpha-keto aciddehydrogenase complex [Osedax symbiont Rs2]